MYADFLVLLFNVCINIWTQSKVCVRGSHLQRTPPTLEAPTRGNAELLELYWNCQVLLSDVFGVARHRDITRYALTHLCFVFCLVWLPFDRLSTVYVPFHDLLIWLELDWQPRNSKYEISHKQLACYSKYEIPYCNPPPKCSEFPDNCSNWSNHTWAHNPGFHDPCSLSVFFWLVIDGACSHRGFASGGFDICRNCTYVCVYVCMYVCMCICVLLQENILFVKIMYYLFGQPFNEIVSVFG